MATNPTTTASTTKLAVTQQPRTYQEMLNYMLPTKTVDDKVYVPRITTNSLNDPNQLNDFDHWHGASGSNPHTHVGDDITFSRLNTDTGKESLKNLRKRACLLCFLGLFALLLTSTFAFAGQRSIGKKPDPKNLIGKEVTGDKYPDGWMPELWAIHGNDHNFVVLRKNNFYAFVLERIVLERSSTTSKIVDAVSLKGRPQKDGWHDMSTDCRGPSIPTTPDTANEQILFIAEVVYKKCARYSNNILSAWQVDLQKNTIFPRPTSGMRCGNTYLDSGEIPECKFLPKEW